MPNNAEKKNISRLDFKVDDAINSLQRVNKELEAIAQKAEGHSKTISQAMNKSFSGYDYSKDIAALQKKMKKYEQLTIAQQQTVSTSLHKEMNKRYTKQVEHNQKTERQQQKTADKERIINSQKNARIEIDNNKHQNKMEEMNARQLKSTKTMYDKIAGYAKTYLIYQGFNELRRGITETIEEMVEVQYQMTAIDRVLSESSLNIDAYRDKLIQLAYDYGNSFENVADITLRLAQAGFDSNESLMLTENTLLALNTAELDATQATEDMVAVMAQWGLMTGTATQKADAYGSIIDKINKVADNFPTTSADIMEALKKTSSAFNIAGASINETIASIVAAETASQRGGKAIGTALSNIAQQLKAEGRLNLAEQMGLDFFTDASKTEFRPIMDIFGDMATMMQNLKDQGKESSVEMQNLLEMFTVFRRNIGASLLGEMAGEDSTYAQVLKTAQDSLGYSLQENEKHMKTAKAAQAQFNAELLKFKTAVWDNGVEDVFRSMLLLGSDIAKMFTTLIETFGAVPTAIGVATLAFTAFNDKMRIANNVVLKGTDGTQIITRQYTKWVKEIKLATAEIKKQNTHLKVNADGTGRLKLNIGGMAKGMTALAGQTAIATLKTIGLEVATLALNAALTLGLSVAITALVKLFDDLIHQYDKYIEKVEEDLSKSNEKINNIENEIDSLEILMDQYEKLAKKEQRTPEETKKIYEIQSEINDILSKQNENIDFANLSYDEQLKKLREIGIEKQKQLVEEKREAGKIAASGFVGVESSSTSMKVENQLKKYAGNSMKQFYTEVNTMQGFPDSKQTFGINWIKQLNPEKQLEIYRSMKKELSEVEEGTEKYAEALNYVNEKLVILEKQEKKVTDSTNELETEMARLKVLEIVNSDAIKSAEDYKNVLDEINKVDFEGSQGLKKKIIDLLAAQFPEFTSQVELASGNLTYLDSVVNNHLTTLQEYSDKYAQLRYAQDEYNKTGELTISTLQNLINNDLLQYLSIENGQLKINAQSMLDLAEATKVEAIEALKTAAVSDIEKLAINDVANMSNIAKGAIAQFGDNSAEAGNQAQTASGQIIDLAASIDAAAQSAQEGLGSGIDVEQFKAKVNAIKNTYMGIANSIGKINITTAAYKPQTTSGSRTTSSSDSAEYAAKKAAEEAKRAAEEAYKARLDAFKDYIDETERLEKRWVDKQEDLGQLSNEDYFYIIQQRINRYKKYLEEVKKATWMAEEDRLALTKKYTEAIEDLQVDYFKYLQDQLDDEINALEKANDEKIKLIEEEANARIAALDKVSAATDRAREEEDYQNERQKILEEIAYWEQRTGREAQEALVEARKSLEELDAEWADQLEDWSIEDQIAQIEAERDAEIAAIEAAQAKEIEAMQSVYDAKVKLFVETGQIIYDGSVIQAQNLYNAYKNNFIDPISSELAKLNTAPVTSTPAVSETTTATEQQYETYKIKSGDTLSKIAKNYGTTIEKIMAANPYVTNKNRIYAGKTLQIPKFHEGGIVGGNQEAFALLKPHEVILKPEWAEGINRLAKMARNMDNPITNNSTTVEVKGDLVKIEANIKDKTDAEYLTRRVEKMLKSKFNIKK